MRNGPFIFTLGITALLTSVCICLAADPNVRPARTRPITWRQAIGKHQPEWFKSDEARRIADNVLLLQADCGGWDKNDREMTAELSDEEKAEWLRNKNRDRCTLDNGATHSQLRYLAMVYEATGEEKYKQGLLRGIDYLLTAQYPNGGWPQFHPLRGRYSDHITFNDGAMIGAMRILDETADSRKPFDLGDKALQARCAVAVKKGVDCILKCQIVADGKKTAWCQQHDEVTLKPAGARAFELSSLTASESAGIGRFLMDVNKPSPEVINAVEGAVRWFDQVKIMGIREEMVPDAFWWTGWNKVHVKDPKAGPIWARFYEIGTNKAIYVDRDGVPVYDIADIGYERRNGYAWTGRWPLEVLARYEAWRQKWTPGRNVLTKD